MKTPKIYYFAIVIFSIITISIGMVHAADTTPLAACPMEVRGHGYPGMNVTEPAMQQHILARLDAQGVDVSTAKTLLQNSDTAAVSTWLATYFESHTGEQRNATARFSMSAGVSSHEEKGCNISGGPWPGITRISHDGGMIKNTTRCNTTAIISGLEQKGVDISEVKPALRNGDITTITSWFESYFKAHANEPASRHTALGHRNVSSPEGQA